LKKHFEGSNSSVTKEESTPFHLPKITTNFLFCTHMRNIAIIFDGIPSFKLGGEGSNFMDCK